MLVACCCGDGAEGPPSERIGDGDRVVPLVDDGEDRVITPDRPEDRGPTGGVQRGRHRTRARRWGAEDEDVARHRHAEDESGQDVIEHVRWSGRDEGWLSDTIDEQPVGSSDTPSADLLQITPDRGRMRGMTCCRQRGTDVRVRPKLVLREEGAKDAQPLAARAHALPLVAGMAAASAPGADPPTSIASTAFCACSRFSA